MRTWLDLEARFRVLAEPLRAMRLDAQWGAAGERVELVGIAHHPKIRELEALCGIGGRFLQRSLDAESEMSKILLAEEDPVRRWYLFLAKCSGAMERNLTAYQTEDGGRIHAGSVQEPAAVSANQCLELQVKFPVRDDRKWYQRLYDDYGKQIVIGGMVALIGGLITAIVGLFFG